MVSAGEKEWEDQLKAFLLSQEGKKIIKGALEDYAKEDVSKRKDKPSQILSVEFNSVDMLESCSGLMSRMSTSSHHTLTRCHEILNTVKCQCKPVDLDEDVPILR